MPESFEQRLKRRLEENRKAFEGLYATQLNTLMGLSREEIDAIVPGTTDLEIYAQLIEVVNQASSVNLKQAELKSRIQNLGEVALKIASKVPGLI
jgi:hypothetical protein